MPELPEVETIRLGLKNKLIGLEIKKVEILSPKSFIGNPKKVKGKEVKRIWRRAKILGIELTSSLRDHKVAKQSQNEKQIASSMTPRNDDLLTMLIHLKMSGQLIFENQVARVQSPEVSRSEPRQRRANLAKGGSQEKNRFIGGHPTLDMLGKLPNKSTRVIFGFSDNSKLYFNDQRRFGWVRIVEGEEGLEGLKILKGLGPEPLKKDFTWQILKSYLLNHKSLPIKVALLDQTIISGIGNIYASESCFNAGVDPRKKVTELSDQEFKKLYQGIIKALKDGIKYGGSSRVHFVDADGNKGYFLDYANVYWKEKHPCKICGTEIKKIMLRGRGTYFCEHCQN